MDTEYLGILSSGLGVHPLFLVLVLAWSLVWKGVALWQSAGLRQKWWFIVLLVVNTLGILEIIYIFFVARKYKLEVVEREST